MAAVNDGRTVVDLHRDALAIVTSGCRHDLQIRSHRRFRSSLLGFSMNSQIEPTITSDSSERASGPDHVIRMKADERAGAD